MICLISDTRYPVVYFNIQNIEKKSYSAQYQKNKKLTTKFNKKKISRGPEYIFFF